MKVGLITPLNGEVNPGSHLITAGIRYLIRQAAPAAVFVDIEMLEPNETWHAAPTCDVLVLCGNPRFSMFDRAFWECDIWLELAKLQAAGVRIIDAWSGASHPSTTAYIEEMASDLMRFPRTAEFMDHAIRADGRITRDPVMQAMYRMAGAESVLLPCSSWWAASEYGVTRSDTAAGCLVTVLGMPGHDQMSAAVRTVIHGANHELGEVRLIASVPLDHEHMRDLGMRSELISDPEALLEAYRESKRVIAFRLHSAIPAASLGCEVCLVAIDSRALAAVPFGIPVIGLDQVGARPFKFAQAKKPDLTLPVETLRGMLQ